MLMRKAARVTAPPRQRQADMASFSAPIAGWIANRALSLPGGVQGAAVLENWFPTATGAILRRGSAVYVQVSETDSVPSIFKYVVGNVRKLFAATASTIYDITTIVNPVGYVVGAPGDYDIGEADYVVGEPPLGDANIVWSGALGGDWHTVQFATTGGIFLIGVNGTSVGFIYDGAAFYPNVAGGVWTIAYSGETAVFVPGETVTGGTSAATAIVVEDVASATPGVGALLVKTVTGTFSAAEALTGSVAGAASSTSLQTSVVPGVTFPGTLTSADMAFVWVYKKALWFVQKDSLSAWYLPVDQIGGTATEYPLGGEFGEGGSLLLGQSWSLNASGQGGLSEQNVFLSTEGEIVVFQGSGPSEASTWGKVGTYQIGTPMGRRAFIRAGGDLIFATTIGFVALSTAVQVDVAALSPKAVSYAIEDIWNSAVAQRGRQNWVCCLWPESQMVTIAPPRGDYSPAFYVSNTRTGAWAPFTNWNAICMEVFDGELYFGTPDGFVMKGMVGGTDNGSPFAGTYMPLFSDEGKPSVMKVAQMARCEIKSVVDINERLFCRFDFDDTIPSPPDVNPVTVGSEWDNAIWGESLWSAERPGVITKRRHSVNGSGYRLSQGIQITSGAAVPLDAQIITVDVTYTSGDIFT